MSETTSSNVSGVGSGSGVGSMADELAQTDAADAALEASVVDSTVAEPFSMLSNCESPLKSGTKRVHQKAMRIPRSKIRCFKMKSTTRRKKSSAEKMSTRSSQSDFSSAVISCFDVSMTLVRVSWVFDADRRVAVESAVEEI
jgi:hypothetical protein